VEGRQQGSGEGGRQWGFGEGRGQWRFGEGRGQWGPGEGGQAGSQACREEAGAVLRT